MNSHLQIRLKNCLQTILDLEPDMDTLPARADFRPDMDTLKTYLARVEDMDLVEEDVQRLERATAHFLAELRLPMEHMRQGCAKSRVLQ